MALVVPLADAAATGHVVVYTVFAVGHVSPLADKTAFLCYLIRQMSVMMSILRPICLDAVKPMLTMLSVLVIAGAMPVQQTTIHWTVSA